MLSKRIETPGYYSGHFTMFKKTHWLTGKQTCEVKRTPILTKICCWTYFSVTCEQRQHLRLIVAGKTICALHLQTTNKKPKGKKEWQRFHLRIELGAFLLFARHHSSKEPVLLGAGKAVYPLVKHAKIYHWFNLLIHFPVEKKGIPTVVIVL